MPNRCNHPIKRWCWGYREDLKKSNWISYFITKLSYLDRLVHLGLFTHTQVQKITWWHDRGFKITKHKYDYKVAPELIYNINKVTTGNNFGLSKNRSHYDLRKFSFTTRIVNIWNSLPNAVVDVDSVDLFKSKLDNFWMCQDVKYNYIVNLAGTGDRSEYDIENFWKVVAVFREWYGHRGSSEPASVNIIDLTWLLMLRNLWSHYPYEADLPR